MNRKSSISLGPGASSLILIFVVLSLTALGMLSLMTGRNDLRLAQRSVQVTEAVYRLQVRAEERRAELDGILAICAGEAETEEQYLAAVEEALPDDVEFDGARLLFTEGDGARVLDCALALQPLGEARRTVWERFDLTAETEEDSWNW